MGRRVETPAEPRKRERSGWPIPIRERVKELPVKYHVAKPLLEARGFGDDAYEASRVASVQRKSELAVLVEIIERAGLTAEYEARLAAFEAGRDWSDG